MQAHTSFRNIIPTGKSGKTESPLQPDGTKGTAPQTGGTRRIRYFDLAKGLCILFVVWFHLGVRTDIDLYLNALRMPLYFFLSGFFFKTYGGFDVFVRKKVKKLLVPFLFFYCTTSVMLPIVLHRLCVIDFSTGNDWTLLYAFLTYRDFPNIPLWFLWGLFVLNIVFYALHRVCRNIVVLGLVCLGLHLLAGYALELPASLSRACCGLTFFYCGYLLHGLDGLRLLQGRLTPVLAGCAFVAIGCLPAASGSRSALPGMLMSLSGILTLIAFCQRVGHIPYVSYLGRYSIMVLVTHEPLLRLLSTLHVHNPYLQFALVIASYSAIIPFMRRYLPHVTAQK